MAKMTLKVIQGHRNSKFLYKSIHKGYKLTSEFQTSHYIMVKLDIHYVKIWRKYSEASSRDLAFKKELYVDRKSWIFV